jgi:adenylylsulfate kinase
VKEHRGQVVWFTGLSGAGKSTLCIALASELRRQGHRVQIIDGDNIRRGLCSDLGFSFEDRAENVRRVVHVADLMSVAGTIVLVAVISPLKVLRDTARANFPDMLEIFVDAPLAVCEQRDPKGLYKQARAGRLPNFTGIDSPFEAPSAADVVCRTDQETVEMCISKILVRMLGEKEISAVKRRQTIAVDFDGVIADYQGWKGANVLGAPRADVIVALQALRAEGWKIVVHTTRGEEDIRTYLTDAHVPFDEINLNSDYVTRGPKPVATVYWDDRAVTYSGDALLDLTTIRSFRTWSERI